MALLYIYLGALMAAGSGTIWYRLLMVVALALVLRKLLRACVLMLGQKEDILLGKEVDRYTATRWVALFLIACGVVTAVTCSTIGRFVMSHSSEGGDFLTLGLDGLALAFVVELLLDCLLPFAA